MTHTRVVAAGLATSTILLLGACKSSGSDETDAASPAATTTAPASTATETTPSGRPPATSDATDEPDPTSEPSSTPSTFFDYEAVDENGVSISTPADTARLKGAPADLKAYLGALITKQASDEVEGCTEAPQISVTQVDTGGWARGSYFIPGCGGAAALWARSGGAWTEAWSGQSLVDCSTLKRYAFPSRVAGDTCDTGSSAQPYTR